MGLVGKLSFAIGVLLVLQSMDMVHAGKKSWKKEIEILKRTMEEMNVKIEGLAKPNILFNAHLSGDVVLVDGQNVLYDNILANEGDAYDSNTGIFRAPVKGSYVFAVKTCSYTNNWDDLVIVKDDVIIGLALSGDTSYSDCGTAVAPVYLDAGSEVWVKRLRGGGAAKQRTLHWCSFTGVLVA